MTTLAILDRTTLQKVAQEGASLKKISDERNEKDCRHLMYATANNLYMKELSAAISEITKTAKTGGLDHFIPILQSPWEKGYWKNIHRFEDNRIWFDGVYDKHYPTLNTLLKVFKDGVIRKDDKVRKFDEYQRKRVLAWMVAKKLTATFLQRNIEVAVLKTRVHITFEYQRKIDHKSGWVEMHFLRVSWG